MVFVVISDIIKISKLCSTVHNIRSTQKGPLFVFGTNTINDRKRKKEIEMLVNKKLCDLFRNICGVYFLSSSNSRTFLSNLTKSTSQFCKNTYEQSQIENMIVSEYKLSNIPIIKYPEFEKMVKGCVSIEKPNQLKKIIEYFHNYGMITYFNPTIWGENKIIILQPYYLVQLLRNSDIITDDPNLILSPMWIFSFVTFLQKTEIIFDLNLSNPLKFQFRRIVQEIMQLKKISVSLSQLVESPYDWDMVNDLWDTFSYRETTQNTFNKENSEDFKKESSQVFYDKKSNFIEKWYFMETNSLSFLNKAVLQILRMSNAEVMRIWNNLVVWNLGLSTFVLGFFASEDGGYFLKFRAKGTNVQHHFFIINDIIECVAKNIFVHSKSKLFLPFIAYPDFNEISSIEMSELENSFLENRHNLPCPHCKNDNVPHTLNCVQIAPFLYLKHLQQHMISSPNIQKMSMLSSGSCGVVYKAKFENSLVAVKEIEIGVDLKEVNRMAKEEIYIKLESLR